MRLGRNTTDRLWTPYRSSYVSSISVIEKPEPESKDQEGDDVKKVPFGFARAVEEDQ